MLELKNVDKYFNRRKKNQIHVINNTTLEFEETGLIALLGSSGSGKTTLLNTIGGLDKIKRGQIILNGEKINSKFSYKVDKIRNMNIGYIFQDYKLLDNLSVSDNVALVLKLIQILKFLDCRIHIGTATMPSILYKEIKNILDGDLLEIKLSNNELVQFNRHIIHKVNSFENTLDIIKQGVLQNQKIIIVANTIRDSQEIYEQVKVLYPNISKLLLHSKFKRRDRNIKEKQLLGLDENGDSLFEFNTSNNACIVVSTQIVEVSLDISFDIMITATAPLDAMIQRFGRVNRKRNKSTIGFYKDIYVIAPAGNIRDARPYDLEVLQKSFEVLPNNAVLEENKLQEKLDYVYTEIDLLKIDEHCIYNSEGGFTLRKLTHRSKAILFELLQIDSVSCITESDVEEYNNGDYEKRLNLEIPVNYWNVSSMQQSTKGNKPFIIPDKAYDFERGLETSEIKQENFNVQNQFL